jgi:DNA-binding beta-propeller fold protein YncE
LGELRAGRQLLDANRNGRKTLKALSAHARAFVAAAAMSAAALCSFLSNAQAQPAGNSARPLPIFEIDPDWPKWPANYRLPFVSGAMIDPQGNAWLTTRPARAQPDPQKAVSPPIMIFDPQGNFIRGWGGPGPGYQWPASEHNVYLDYKGFVWISGDSCKGQTSPADDDQILKFTQDGKFVMQIGHSSAGKGDNDTENFRRPPNVQVNPKTNELFVADGYGNHRIIVLDADTGKFKRMWGAFGNPPMGPEWCFSPDPKTFEGDGVGYFATPHVLLLSHDDLLYVADRSNRRIQVFSPDGKFIHQLARYDAPFARNLAFSPDPDQTFIYTGYDKGIAVIDRKSMEYIGMIQAPGLTIPGHQIATDAKGNLYVTGVNRPGQPNVERLIYKGMSTPARQ